MQGVSRRRRVGGSITVFLSILFLLFISFVGSILEHAVVEISKNYKRADMERAIEAIFAEYQKALFEEYCIFSLESTYETGVFDYQQVLDRLSFYEATDMEHEIVKLQLLTDHGGRAYHEQVLAYMEQSTGLDYISAYLPKIDGWKQEEVRGNEYEMQEAESHLELDRVLSEDEEGGFEGGETMDQLGKLRETPLLSLCWPKDRTLSEGLIELDHLPSKRSLRTGHGSFEQKEETIGLSKLLFGQYLFERFQTATSTESGGVLAYEMEYILGGKQSDKENLSLVARKLLTMRLIANAAYLATDEEKKAVMLSTSVGMTAMFPPAQKPVELALFGAWVFGESIMDLRALFSGKNVPLIKSKESWQLSFGALFQLGTDEDMGGSLGDDESGQSYEEYLRVLLFLEADENLTMRSLDLIEKNMQVEKGFTFFLVDQCIQRMEIQSTCALRGNIRYTFKTDYGYR